MRSNQQARSGTGGEIELVNLTKSYERAQAPVLKGINLSIRSGEFFSLLGPSGCGQTTTLRLIGGFESADEGEVRIDGVDMVSVPPENRPLNTVFQSYALFPHLSVANLLPAKVSGPGRVVVNGAVHSADTAGIAGDCTVVIRPERVLLSPLGSGHVEAVPAVVEQRIYVGAVTQVLLRLGEHKLQALVANDGSALCGIEGETVDAYLPPGAIRVLSG